MNAIEFTIHGNQEKREGNPVPYCRSTQRSQWTPSVRRYNEWKDYVRKIFEETLQTKTPDERVAIMGGLHRELCAKPIGEPDRRAFMDMKIYWGKGVHGDCDNVWKGICDALFENDNNVAGSFDFAPSPEKKGRVEIKLRIE